MRAKSAKSAINAVRASSFLLDLEKIRRVADYQFGRGVGASLFPDNVSIVYSRRTGRIRHVYSDDMLLATLRPRDGLFSLTVAGANRIAQRHRPPPCYVVVHGDAEPFVRKGGTLFAKHVAEADARIRPRDEVIVLDSGGGVVAVGRAVLTGREMTRFRRGVAAKIRRGVDEEKLKRREGDK